MVVADSQRDASGTDERWPGDFLLHPISLAAVAVLIVNDWYIKGAWPGVVAGKASDLAGLVFFPLLLVALAELLAKLLGRPWLATTRTILWVALTVGALFAGTKSVGAVRTADEAVLGWLRWTPHAVLAFATGEEPGPVVRPHVMADLTDLLAVPFVLAAVWIGSRYRSTNPREHAGPDR